MDENYLRYYLQYAQGVASLNERGGVVSMKEKYYKDFSSLYKERIYSYAEQAGGIAGGIASIILAGRSWKKGALLGLLSGALYIKGKLDSTVVDSTIDVTKKAPIDVNVSTGQQGSTRPIFLPPPSPLGQEVPSSSRKGTDRHHSSNQTPGTEEQLDRPVNVIINNNIIKDEEPNNSYVNSRTVLFEEKGKGEVSHTKYRQVESETKVKRGMNVRSEREDVKSEASHITNSLSDELTLQ